MKTVIIPKECEKDMAELDEQVKANVEFVTASVIDDVIAAAFSESPFEGGKEMNMPVSHSEPRMNVAEISQ